MTGAFKNIGIHARVLSSAVVLITAATLTLGYLGVYIISQFVTKRFHQRIDFMAQYLALNCELGILIGEQGLLQGLVENMLKEDDISGVQILDHTGNILAEGKKLISGPFEQIEKKVFPSESQENPGWIGHMGHNQDSEGIGRIRVSYSIQGIENLMVQMKKRMVYGALILTLAACIIFYYISRSLVAPLVSLADTARKVSMGNRMVRASPGTSPEIANLSDAFNNMLDSLAAGRKTLIQAYEKMTRQETLVEVGKFSMMIAHEIKNPLGIIKSSLEMMKSDLKIPGDFVPLAYAEEEIDRLNTLIESFLMFSRPARPNFRRVDLNRLLEQVVMGFDIQYASEQLSMDCQVPETHFEAEADFDLLTRGISNIIKNACEANGKTGVIWIRVSEQFKQNGQPHKWQLFITDQGPGISREARAKVFEPFFTTKSTGTGLGLAFADQAVKVHGGNITIESPENGGCRFCLTLFSNLQEPEVLKEYGKDINR